jgi:hypothetical protein
MKTADWKEIIYRGVETQELDYKAAQNWSRLPRAGKAKFVRHAMALANTRGGYIVIGVGEDPNGNPVDYQGLSEQALKSFDPSIVGQFINLYADPAIDIDVVRPEVDGKHYAVLVIRPFSGLPHVCADHCGEELQQGAFYLRTPDARSRPAYRASELQGLVQRALRNQREVLGRMLRGVLYEGRQFAEPDAEQEFQHEYQQSEHAARQWIGPKNLNRFCVFELTAYPSAYEPEERMLSDLREALLRIRLPAPPELLFLNGPRDEVLHFTNQTLRGRIKDDPLTRFQFMQLFPSGLLHLLTSQAPCKAGGTIEYPALIRQLTLGLCMLGGLYAELGMEDELITFTLALKNTAGCKLTETGTGNGDFKCYIPDITVKKRRTVADLCADPAAHAGKVIKEVCERFNFDASRHVKLRSLLREILGGAAGPPACGRGR